MTIEVGPRPHVPRTVRACLGGDSAGAATTPIRAAAHGESRVSAFFSALTRSSPRRVARVRVLPPRHAQPRRLVVDRLRLRRLLRRLPLIWLIRLRAIRRRARLCARLRRAAAARPALVAACRDVGLRSPHQRRTHRAVVAVARRLRRGGRRARAACESCVARRRTRTRSARRGLLRGWVSSQRLPNNHRRLRQRSLVRADQDPPR